MVPSVTYAIRILQCLARSPEPLGVTGVARAIGMSQSSCFNIMKTLVAENVLTFDQRTKLYDMGVAVAEFAAKLRSSADVMTVFRPQIEALARDYSSLAAVWQIMPPDSIVVIAKAGPPGMARIDIPLNWTSPIYSGAIGRCVAAATTEPETQRRDRFERAPWQGKVTYAEWTRQVEEVRQRGWAHDDGQFIPGVWTVAALVGDADGSPRFAISNLMFRDQHDAATILEIGEHTKAMAAEAAQALFGVAALAPDNARLSARKRARK